MVADFPYCVVASFRHQDKNLVAVDKPFTYEPLGVALPTNDPLLVNLVENTLLTLEGSGALLLLTAELVQGCFLAAKAPVNIRGVRSTHFTFVKCVDLTPLDYLLFYLISYGDLEVGFDFLLSQSAVPLPLL